MGVGGNDRVKVFTYGSLVVSEVWALVAGRLHEAEPAVLHGFRRRQIHGASYPGIIPAQGEHTEGILWSGVNARELERLDDFEGDMYERRAVAVQVDSGTVQAEVYVVLDEHAHLLSPNAWDEALFRSRELAVYLEGCRAFAADWDGRSARD